MLTRRPRGTEDILGEDIQYWRLMENLAREICTNYDFREIRTPIFEHTELFQRGVGETTDIVEKEMYSFLNKNEQTSLTLRPEGTAPVVRAFIENSLYAGPQPTKVFYLGSMFRYGRPQAGRLRQFHQFGVEVFGSNMPVVDAEVISLAMNFYHKLGLRDLELHLNSVGCPKCRTVHRERLQSYFRPYLEELCETCRDRFGRNPLRILDCKGEKCGELAREAPKITDHICDDCAQHFMEVRRCLDRVGTNYILDPGLVRGLDYYTKTAFEIEVKGIGAQNSIGGGGRYDGLVREIGGRDIPGIGFGLGLERVMLAMKDQGITPPGETGIVVYVVTVGKDIALDAFELVQELREAGIAASMDYLDRSVKAQFKNADRSGAPFTVVLGSEELAAGVVGLREMDGGSQQNVARNELVEIVKQRRDDVGNSNWKRG